MIKEEKKWLYDCIEAYVSLRQLCMDFDDNLVGDAYLEWKIAILFPIFKEKNNFVVKIGYQKNDVDFMIFEKELYMLITFPKNISQTILKWFEDSYFENYVIYQKSDIVGIKYRFIDG